jgi:hypothetical protein
MKTIFATVLVVLLSGCGLFQWKDDVKGTVVTIESAELEALRAVVLSVPENKIDFGSLVDVKFQTYNDNGTQYILLSYDDYVKILKSLKLIENHIRIERDTLNKVMQFYEQNLDRQEIH